MKEKKFQSKLIIVIFIIMLLLPVIGHTLGWDKGIVLVENRNLAEEPVLSISGLMDFAGLYDSYFNDNFGFRPDLLELGHLINIKFFHVAPPDSGVTIGKDGWLFYTSGPNYLDAINAEPFSETDLAGAASNLETIQNHFQKMGVHFYFMVAPNSQTIYPEELPERLKKVHPESRLDQVTSYLSEHHTKVNFINPVRDLSASKPKAQLYYKYDTHWDDYGAFIAYQDLMARITQDFSEVSPKKLTDYYVTPKESGRKDMESLMGVSGFYSEKVPTFTPKFSPGAIGLTKECADPYVECALVEKKINNSSLPKMVAYRDSFFSALIPFLSENFSYSTYLWGVAPYSTEIVEKEHPDIVIFEITERELWRLTSPIFDFQK